MNFVHPETMRMLAAYGSFPRCLLRWVFSRQVPPSAGQEVRDGAEEVFCFAGLAALREVFPMFISAA